MSKTILDPLDYDIISQLSEDGRMPVGEIAKKLNVTAPTIRSRIKNLEEQGLFKIAGLVDPNRHQNLITAMVGMSIQSEGQMDKLMNQIAQLPNVAWAAVVAGRYDIIAEVVCMGGMKELYQFTTETILTIGNVVRSETFIIMKSSQNWLHLPKWCSKDVTSAT